ncbi:hydroxyacyl-thioester dehydratase type 2, mitochondrial-like [Sycon ciliatum]|uniref:hydroxyacyl-thioester dehydratase type 2, mitochondrial-like n=1 Tax=Sycon ciliatum TaxID=27933 RepID=UPI0020A8532A|eukprot:scpid97240/ scgid26418/ Hydroxyacyl-thioester dehydratase type 2, mitochondrial; 3-hydroxyacyl-[acyl-carrier-protein] dehydratase
MMWSRQIYLRTCRSTLCCFSSAEPKFLLTVACPAFVRRCSNITNKAAGSGTCAVGDEAEARRSFSAADVDAFAVLSGDTNPLHLDDNYAKDTRFGQRIVHGLLVHSMISALLGTRMPGTGSIYVSQTLHFTAPVFIDEEVLGVVRVKERRKSLAIIETICTAVERDKVVLHGEAVVKCTKT